MRARTFNKLDIIVLGFFVSSSLVGVYTISWNIASVLGIFAASLSATLFPELSKLAAEDRDGDVRELVEKSLSYAGLVHIPGLVGALILGRRMLRVYGTEFISGYVVLVVLILAYLIHSYNKQLLTALEGLDHPEKAFRANLALIVSNVVSNVVLIYVFGWIGAAVATTLSVCFSFILGYWYLTNLIDFAVPIRMVEKQILAAGIMGAVVYLLLKAQQTLFLIDNNVLVLGILISTGATIYFAVLLLLSSQFRNVVVDNIPSNLSNL
jgi:O-antigen/teichoic acid export membrane protein